LICGQPPLAGGHDRQHIPSGDGRVIGFELLVATSADRRPGDGLLQVVHRVAKEITARSSRLRGQPRAPSPASAALAALRPHTPWTPPPGVALALPR